MAEANIIDALLELQNAGIDLSGLKGKIPGAVAGLAGKQFQARTGIERAKLLSELGISEAEAKAVIQSSLLDQKHQQAMEVGSATSSRQADLKRLSAELEMAKTQQEVDLALQKMREADALRRAQSVELGALYEKAKPLAMGALTKSNELDLVLTEMRKFTTGGDVMADGIENMIRTNRNRLAQDKLDELKGLMKSAGHDVPDDESLLRTIEARIERHGPAATIDDIQKEQLKAAEKAKADQASAERMQKQLAETEPGKRSIFRYPTAEERRQQLESGRTVAEIQGENRKVGRARGIAGGAIGGAIAAFLASKILGGGEGQQAKLPPELQLALMQQMPRGGGGGEDGGLGEGRALLNMSRAVGLVKQMQDLAAASGASQAPPVYRLV